MLKQLSHWFLTLLFCFSFTSVFSSDDSEIYAKKGIIDLRKHDFSKNAKVKGEWFFYWNQLIAPSNSLPPGGLLVNFPLKWTDYKTNGKTLPSVGYASYTSKLLLPHDSAVYTLLIPPTYSSYKFFINNRLVAVNGKVTTSPKGFVPHFQTKLVNLNSTNDTIILTLQVANYAHSKGGTMDPLIIGRKENLELKKIEVTLSSLY